MYRIFTLIVSAMLALSLTAQQFLELPQVKLSRWDIGTAQFSGITPLGNGRYAVVSDKEPTDGFFLFRIDQNATTGEVESVYLEDFFGNPSPVLDDRGNSVRDTEGVAYCSASNTIYISGEGDQRILEYSLQGLPTGRELNVPPIFSSSKIVSNYGFEALTYCPQQHLFWTVTESTLKADGPAAGFGNSGVANVLRLQAFGENLQPVAQYAYRMESGRQNKLGKYYCMGVPALTALPDGRLLVLERELNVSKAYLNSEVICKIFLVDPATSWQIDSSIDMKTLDHKYFVVKQQVASFKTQLNPVKNSFANYEGMCLGRELLDGRQTLLLINDSQAGSGWGPYRIHDFIKVLVF